MSAAIVENLPPPVEQFKDLIFQQAHRCLRRLPPGDNGFDLEDLFAEGLLVYSKFSKVFDPTRGCKFITGFVCCLQRHYASIVRTAWRRPTLICWDESNPDATMLEDMAVDRREPSLREAIGGRLAELMYCELSREAWKVARAVLDPPAAFVTFCSSHHGLRMDTLLFNWLGFDSTTRRRVKNELAIACSKGADKRAGRYAEGAALTAP